MAYKYVFEEDDSVTDSSDDDSCSSSSLTMSDLSQASITSGPRRPSTASSTDQKQRGGIRRGKRGGKKPKDGKTRKDMTIVWVGNLRSTCTAQQVLEHFSSYKSYICNKPRILSPKKGTTGNPFTFLHFDTIDKANEVIRAMNRTELHGCRIYVKLKESKKGSSSSTEQKLTVETVAKHDTESYEARYTPEEWGGISEDDEDDDESVFSCVTDDTHKDGATGKGKGRNKRQQFTVGIHNLPPGCTSEELLDHLSLCKSDICNKNFRINNKKSSSYFFAFLKFESQVRAKEVVDRMNNTTFKKRKIHLKLQEKTGGSSESKKEQRRPTSSQSSDTRPDTPSVGSMNTVLIFNVPEAIDCDDLKGLAAKFQPVSCSINGQNATLTFSSAKLAVEAHKMLDKKLVCGGSLRATLGESKAVPLVGEAIHKDSLQKMSSGKVTATPNKSRARDSKKKVTDPPRSPLSPKNSGALFPQPPSGRSHSVSDGLLPHGPPIPYPNPEQVPHPPLSHQKSVPLMPVGYNPLPPHGHHQPLPPTHGHHQPLPPPHGHHQPLPPPHGHHQPLPPPHGHHQPLPPPRGHHQPLPPPRGHHQPLPPPHGVAQQPLPPPHGVGQQPLPPPHGVAQQPLPPHGVGQQPYSRSYSDGNGSAAKEPPKKRDNNKSSGKRLVHNKSLSIELYNILCKSEEARINEFKRKEGTIDYYQPRSNMIVCGPPAEVTSLMKQFERYIERELSLSPHQWNSLVQVDQQGKRRMDEISAPFLANPVVKITEPQPLKILIVGVKEAVDGAYEHFVKYMNKEIKADSSKIAALVQLMPDLPQQICSKYGVIIRGYTIGSTAIELQDVSNHETASVVHEQLEEKLSSLCCTTVPAVVPPSLMGSAKDVCYKDGFSVIVKEEQGQVTLWTTSLDSLEKAKNVFSKKPHFNKIELSRFNEACLYFSFSERFTFDNVNIRKEDNTVVLEGYNKQEVQSAKKVVVKFLNETFAKQKVEKIVEETLKCSEPQLVYLTRSLQSSDEPDEVTKSLPAKVCLKDGKISIKGTKEEISETADGLLDSVPKHSKRTFEGPRNPHFLSSLLKSYVLATIDHIIMKDKEAGGRVMVYLYENNANALTDVEEKLDAIDPRVLTFTMSPKAKNILKKMVGDLERQERCRIDLMKLDNPRIAVHGLTQQERDRAKAAIKDYISENYTIVKEIPSPHVTGVQMKYVLSKHGEDLKKLGRGLKQCNIPVEVTQKSPFDIPLDPSVFIKVVGTSKAISAFEDSILPDFSSDFAIEKFELRIRNIHRFPWNRRWSTLKQEAEATQAVVMDYRLPKQKRDDRDGSVQFIIYGDQSLDVRQLRDTIESEVAAGPAEAKIKLKEELVGQVRMALKKKQLNFDDYLIKVICMEKDGMVYLNSLAIADDCLELVKAEINGFLECTDTSCKEVVEFDDSQLFALFMSKNFSFFSDASAIAKKVDVRILTLKKQSGPDHPSGKIPGICLSGSKAAVNAVKMQIDQINAKIKAIVDTKRMTVDSLLQCALTPAVKISLEKKLQEDYCVHITAYQPAKNRPVIRQKTLRAVSIKLSRESSVIKLTLVKGFSVEDLSSQSTDVVVIPTSMDLQHVSPVARDVFNKGGPILKKECDNYIRKTGMLAVGEVVMTGSGWLKCQSVVHAVVPVWMGQKGDKESIYTAVFNSLAESAGYTSVSFPALGCDNHFEIPTVECAEMSLRAVRDFFITHSSSSLKELTFILFKDDTSRSFMDAISTVFPVDSIISDDVNTTDPSLSTLATSSTGLQWQWKNDQGGYSNYSPQDCRRINDAYQRNPSGRFLMTIGVALYTIDFNRMVQINDKTNFERKITFVHNGISPTATASWHWTNDSGKLTPYNPTESDKLEAMYRLKQPRMIVIGGKLYRFDFDQMVQINALTSSVRKIHRKVQARQTTPTFEASGFPVKSSQTDSIIITLRGPKSNLQASENEVRRYLKQSIREERIQLTSKVDQSFMAKINDITTKHSVLYELEDGTQGKKVLIIKGVNVDKAVNKIQRYIIEQQATSEDIDIPQEWQQQSGTTEVFQLARGTVEWINVEDIFSVTMPGHPIKEILRIQNLYLWEKWVEERKRIEKFKGCVNEKELFHGTGKNDPKVIYDSEIGFDMRFCSSGMWGQANYFAVNASYSHNYAHTNTLGQHEMFLVRLITGDSYTSEPDKTLRMPPLKDDIKMGLSQVRYDTVNGTTRGSRVFMSYDNQKAYPAYLIRYS